MNGTSPYRASVAGKVRHRSDLGRLFDGACASQHIPFNVGAQRLAPDCAGRDALNARAVFSRDPALLPKTDGVRTRRIDSSRKRSQAAQLLDRLSECNFWFHAAIVARLTTAASLSISSM